MNTESIIQELGFPPIGLKEADRAKLMNRVDKKYLVNANLIPEILNQIKDHYYILTIKECTVLPYHTEYFDTENRDMYLAHHNKRPLRYKIRVRSYIASQQTFLEVKVKTPKGRTNKMRVEGGLDGANNSTITSFIHENTPYSAEGLKHTLTTDFSRISLIGRSYKERVTIDINLSVSTPIGYTQSLPSLCIIEVKQDKREEESPLVHHLRQNNFRPASFSKYAIGTALLVPSIKANSFKAIIRNVKRITHA
ncbi:MAG: polyphosphate polymerase domain-containing protein [Bacteroidales bacterium]|nr:polyphosphate polymerase domain-containing protein [Bacteroidales bacterium]MBN2748642.1 polyphosphate polymerase domain-containing protein [Bacteroidales bacterium]